MSKTPIILVSGKAGSGKDTVGAYIKENYNAGTIALADPMKRLAADLFGFSELTLWGPSSCRNEEQHLPQLAFIQADDVRRIAAEFVAALDLPNQVLAAKKLDAWFWGQAMEHHEKGKISARTVLQTLGTEWGRAQSRNMWVKFALKQAQSYLDGEMSYDRTTGLTAEPGKSVDYVVITDGRFRNEVLGVSAVNGVSFRVHRPDQVTQTVGIKGHASEKELDGIPSHFYTETLMNDKDIPALFGAVADAMAVTFGDLR